MEHLRSDSMVAFGSEVAEVERGDVRSEAVRFALKNNDDLRTIGGYLVSFGDDKIDSHQTYFDAETYYGPHKGDGMDVMIHHGFPVGRGLEEFADTLLPAMKTTEDDVGLWAETVVNLSKSFEKEIFELVKEGYLKWSSGSAAHMVKVDSSTGRMIRWPIIEGSLTPTPSEWRGSTVVMPLKSYISSIEENEKEPMLFPAAERKGKKLSKKNMEALDGAISSIGDSLKAGKKGKDLLSQLKKAASDGEITEAEVNEITKSAPDSTDETISEEIKRLSSEVKELRSLLTRKDNNGRNKRRVSYPMPSPKKRVRIDYSKLKAN